MDIIQILYIYIIHIYIYIIHIYIYYTYIYILYIYIYYTYIYILYIYIYIIHIYIYYTYIYILYIYIYILYIYHIIYIYMCYRHCISIHPKVQEASPATPTHLKDHLPLWRIGNGPILLHGPFDRCRRVLLRESVAKSEPYGFVQRVQRVSH